jgi:hypothetical protein
MTKLTAQGYEVLDPGRYVLEVLEAESVEESGPQLKLKLRVAQGERAAQDRTDPVGAPGLRSDGRFPRERRWTLKERAHTGRRMAVSKRPSFARPVGDRGEGDR